MGLGGEQPTSDSTTMASMMRFSSAAPPGAGPLELFADFFDAAELTDGGASEDSSSRIFDWLGVIEMSSVPASMSFCPASMSPIRPIGEDAGSPAISSRQLRTDGPTEDAAIATLNLTRFSPTQHYKNYVWC
jgi:hypothetical protein